jgi:hypothetical protein
LHACCAYPIAISTCDELKIDYCVSNSVLKDDLDASSTVLALEETDSFFTFLTSISAYFFYQITPDFSHANYLLLSPCFQQHPLLSANAFLSFRFDT